MGVHCGEPHCEQDQITYRTEYFGPVVNTSSRVAAHAVGGQILVTSDVYQRISENAAKLVPCTAEQINSQIKSGHEHFLLYQVCSLSFSPSKSSVLNDRCRYGRKTSRLGQCNQYSTSQRTAAQMHTAHTPSPRPPVLLISTRGACVTTRSGSLTTTTWSWMWYVPLKFINQITYIFFSINLNVIS
jgi:hypothetical protein